MGNGRDATDAMNERDRVFERKLRALSIGGAVAADVLVEGLRNRRDMPRLEERLGHVRPSDGTVTGKQLDSIPRNRCAKLAQLHDHLLRSTHPSFAELGNGLLKLFVFVVEVEAKQVHLRTRNVAADLNTGD